LIWSGDPCRYIDGTLASNLFVPLLQVVYSAAEQVPPFKVVAYAGIISASSQSGSYAGGRFHCAGIYYSKIKMDQALKLGED
jgi:putative ABC transport system permease protein